MSVRTLMLALVCAASVAGAADQTILGNTFVAKNPSTEAKRKVIGKGKEVGSPNTIVGDPTVSGGFVIARTFAAAGGTPSDQTLPLPQGTSVTGKPFWSGDPVKGFKYNDPTGENGPVKLVQLKRSGSGVFTVKAALVGKNGLILVLPPNPGNGACFAVGINGGDTYSVDFRHNPQITNNGAVLFAAKKPQLEGTCLDPTTTTTHTITPTTRTPTTGGPTTTTPTTPSTTIPTTTTATTTTTLTTVIFQACGTAPSTCDTICPLTPFEECRVTLDATSGFVCQCIPTNVTQCSSSAYPACGGVCSAGGFCQPIRNAESSIEICACAQPDTPCGSPGGPGTCTPGFCPPGQACVAGNVPPFQECWCGSP